MLQNQDNSVSFFTCCYEADWDFFLKDGRLKEMIERCNYAFSNKSLIINNVKNKEEVSQYAAEAIKKGIIDNFYFSEDYIEKALDIFSLKRKDFKLDGYDGYWYSVAPLTAIILCKTDYLLYFTGDCMIDNVYDFNWINKGIQKLEEDKIFTVTPLWNYYNGKPFPRQDELCFYDNGFSDQAFLVKRNKISSVNFKEYHPGAEIFPIYGGNHFERRISSYMNNRQYERCIFKDIIYVHEKLKKPEYSNSPAKNRLKDETKYLIAKVKRRFRRNNILVKLLLR